MYDADVHRPNGYDLSVVVHGFPGVSGSHGGLGWSSVSLLVGGGRTMLVDTGGPGYRPLLLDALQRLGVAPEDVTHVLLTHCHWDHAMNATLFPRATILVGREELAWALEQPPGTYHVPERHVAWLAEHDRVDQIGPGEVLDGVTAIATPGHTPGHLAFRAGAAILAGDAVKNRRELATGVADLTLDADASARSVEALRAICAADPACLLVPGHDAPLRVVDGEVVADTPPQAEITALVGPGDEPVRFRLRPP